VRVAASARRVRVEVPANAPQGTVAALTARGRLEVLDLEANLARPHPISRRPRAVSGQIAVRCGPPTPACPSLLVPPRRAYWYVVRDRPAVRPIDIRRPRIEPDPTTGEPDVWVALTAHG